MVDPIRPVPEQPVLRIADPAEGGVVLVVADLHLGLGSSAARPAGPPEADGSRFAEGLLEIAEAARAHRLVVAGDVKHPIVGTPPALRRPLFDFFGALLEAGLAVDVVLGNHDVGLVRHLPREVEVHPPTGLRVGDVGIFHGHRWPSDRVLRARHYVVGHLHPGFRLAPTPEEPEGKVRCWVRVAYPTGSKPGRRVRTRRRSRTEDLIVLPAFNPLAGRESLNRHRPARGRSFLFQRFLAPGLARAYLLDGTDLGGLTTT